MLGRLKREWREFRNGRPGHRFQDRYERNRKTRSSQPWFIRLLKPAAAIVLIAGGVLFVVIPGPGWSLIVICVGLVADGPRPISRAMDRLEIRARKILAWARRRWNRAPRIAKCAGIFLIVL